MMRLNDSVTVRRGTYAGAVGRVVNVVRAKDSVIVYVRLPSVANPVGYLPEMLADAGEAGDRRDGQG